MTTYKGNFSAYLPQKEAADALRQKQHDADVALASVLWHLYRLNWILDY